MIPDIPDDFESEERVFTIPPELTGERLDRALVMLCDDLSRARLQHLIKDGEILVNEKTSKSSYRIEAGDIVSLSIPAPLDDDPIAENIPLDVVFEDDDVVVINKPAGLVVHPAIGHIKGTLVNALLYHCGDTLSGINGVKRPGIVHRLDKDTSGLIMVAKNDFAHQSLSSQLEDRSLSRRYVAFVLGVMMPPTARVETLIGRHPNNRLKQSVLTRSGREAITLIQSKSKLAESFSWVECSLKTGRTHQIRVHMEHIKHPIIGDPLYGAQPNAVLASAKKAGLAEDEIAVITQFPRQALHAAHLTFLHPRSGQHIDLSAELPDDMKALIKILAFT